LSLLLITHSSIVAEMLSCWAREATATTFPPRPSASRPTWFAPSKTLIEQHHAGALEGRAVGDGQRYTDPVRPRPYQDPATSIHRIESADQPGLVADIDRRRSTCNLLRLGTGGIVYFFHFSLLAAAAVTA
jgi:hypothetical protein